MSKRFVRIFGLEEPYSNSPFQVHHGLVAADTSLLAATMGWSVEQVAEHLLDMERRGLVRLEWIDENF